MTKATSQELLRKVRKLAQLPDEARQGRFGLSVTRLTILKSLCRESEVANRFVTYLALRTRKKVEETSKRSSTLSIEDQARHREMIHQTVAAMETYLRHSSEAGRERLRTRFHELACEQNEYRRIYGGPVRIIKDNDLLLVEYALRTVVAVAASAPGWAYQTARQYSERYDANYGSGLSPASAPLLQDIADFWIREFGITNEQIIMRSTASKPKKEKSPARPSKQPMQLTHRQGQFLAFIHLFRKLHRQGPAEQDMVKYFRATLSSVHGMVVILEQMRLVTREPGVPRSVHVAIPESEIPTLEVIEGPAW